MQNRDIVKFRRFSMQTGQVLVLCCTLLIELPQTFAQSDSFSKPAVERASSQEPKWRHWRRVPLASGNGPQLARCYIGFESLDPRDNEFTRVVFEFDKLTQDPISIDIQHGRSPQESELIANLRKKLKIDRTFVRSSIFQDRFSELFSQGIEQVCDDLRQASEIVVKLFYDKDNCDWIAFGTFRRSAPVQPIRFVVGWDNVSKPFFEPSIVECRPDEQISDLPLNLISQFQGELSAIGKRGVVLKQDSNYLLRCVGDISFQAYADTVNVPFANFANSAIETTAKKELAVCLAVCSRECWRNWNRLADTDSSFSPNRNEPLPMDPLLWIAAKKLEETTPP